MFMVFRHVVVARQQSTGFRIQQSKRSRQVKAVFGLSSFFNEIFQNAVAEFELVKHFALLKEKKSTSNLGSVWEF